MYLKRFKTFSKMKIMKLFNGMTAKKYKRDFIKKCMWIASNRIFSLSLTIKIM